MPKSQPPESSWRPALDQLLSRRDYTPQPGPALARSLRIPPARHRDFFQWLESQELEGRLVRIRGDAWIRPEAAQLAIGVLQFTPRGHAFLIREDSPQDIFIDAEDTHTAFHQDTVVVRLNPAGQKRQPGRRPPPGDANRPTGTVIRILKRRRDSIVGTLQLTGRLYQVVPDDPRFVHALSVPPPQTSALPTARPGDTVVVRLLRWESRRHQPEGELVERLGRPGDPGLDILSIIRRHELPGEFPPEALAEVSRHRRPDDHARDTTGRKRLDLRGECIITIDPDTARDFDDAIHVKQLPGGAWEAGIHIADVAHYVTPGSALDREAARRGNSVYLVDRVIPMLPEELSNGLCSLNPRVDRLTCSVIVQTGADGHIRNFQIHRSIIRSQHRYTYQEAFAALKHAPRNDVEKMLHQAWKLAESWRKARFLAGSLDLDMPEVKVRLDAHNQPVAIDTVVHDISHQLIEEFMLTANELVATHLRRKSLPGVYRVHDDPDPDKLADLRETLLHHGLKPGDLRQKRELQKMLNLIAQRPDAHPLKVAVLRSLRRAEYRIQPIGHYGLGKKNYLHFTSPIRRYADLLVHRTLESPKLLPTPDALSRAARQLCATERTAAEAEQESVKIKKLQFFTLQLEKKNPVPFDAIVMEVSNYGMFVELPGALVTGLVHVSHIPGDFYDFDPRRQRLVGRKRKHAYQVGDRLKVRVERVDLSRQQIDFRPV